MFGDPVIYKAIDPINTPLYFLRVIIGGLLINQKQYLVEIVWLSLSLLSS